MYLVSSVRAERLAVHRRVSDMSLPDTHLEHRSLTFSAWDRTELRLPQQKLAIPVAMVELWEMKWKRRSSRIFCADGGGPTWSNHSLFAAKCKLWNSSNVLCQRCVTGLEFAQRALALQPIDSFSVLSIAQCRMCFMTNFIVLSGKQYNKVCRACRAHDLIM